jgi:hypothetical protein
VLKSEIERRFAPHPRSGNQGLLYEGNHALYIKLAEYISQLGESRELALAFTALQESLMWANAHIACNDIDTEDSNA